MTNPHTGKVDVGAAERARLDLLAAATFPREWARANAKPRARSKARHNLRIRTVAHFKLIELRKQGAACGSCKHFEVYPGPNPKKEMICELGSDFHGFQITTSEKLCTSYARTALSTGDK